MNYFLLKHIIEMAEVAQERQLCGEVYITKTNYVLVVQCKFCGQQFSVHDKFLNHIFDNHFDVIDELDDYQDISNEYDDIDVLNALSHDENVGQAESAGPEENCVSTNASEEFQNIVENTLSNASECEYTEADNILKEEDNFIPGEENILTEISISKLDMDNDKQDTTTVQNIKSNKECKASNPTELNETNIRPVCYKYRSRNGEERNFKCKYCADTFAKITVLRRHEERHTNNKRHSCTICDKRFFSSTERTAHMRRHSGERPFVCTYCGKSYVTHSALNIHEKRHTGQRNHKCEHCEKCFYDAHQLRKHAVVHTKERNYSCNLCQRKFTRSNALKMHMKLHENALRYQCKICEMRFNQKPTLIWHEKSKHGLVRSSGGNNVGGTLPASLNDDIIYECKRCEVNFGDRNALLEHQQLVHAKADALATFEALEEAESESMDYSCI